MEKTKENRTGAMVAENSQEKGNMLQEIQTLRALKKILGPTAESLSAEMSDWSSSDNVQRVAAKASAKNINRGNASIPPRAARAVLIESCWADNEILAEYLSGVLASSQSGNSGDGGVMWASLIGRLPSDQLALHWAIYTAAHRRTRGTDYESVFEAIDEQYVVDAISIINKFGWELDHWRVVTRLFEAAHGLEREGLLKKFSYGPPDFLETQCVYTKGHSFDSHRVFMTFSLTHHGVGLLLQVMGLPDTWLSDFISRSEVTERIDSVTSLPTFDPAKLVSDFPRAHT